MGERGRTILRRFLIVLAVTGAVGYGITSIGFGQQDERPESAETPENTDFLESAETREKTDSSESAGTREKTDSSEPARTQEDMDSPENADTTEGAAGSKETESGAAEFYYAGDGSSFEGLASEVIEQIRRINKGENLSDITGLKELEGCYALIGTQGIKAGGKGAGEDPFESGEVTLYVPNLIKGLKDVSVLFYNPETEAWEMIPVSRADTESKTVTVVLPGNGILTVIYKRQEM